MIKPSDLIKYMRDNRINPAWSIEYASTYAAATDKSKLKLPCFYVELPSIAGTIESEMEFLQGFTATIRIRLVCLNHNDRMGRVGADVAYYARLELFQILLFQQIDTRFNEIYYVRDDFEALDEARYIHLFEFSFNGMINARFIRPEDYDMLESIHVDYDLDESPESEYPNTQIIVDGLQT